MTDQEIRETIAEACGVAPVLDEFWVYSESKKALCMSGTQKECLDWRNQLPSDSPYRLGDWEVIPHYKYPDYPNDLNAMREAEMFIQQFENMMLYRDCLFSVVGL